MSNKYNLMPGMDMFNYEVKEQETMLDAYKDLGYECAVSATQKIIEAGLDPKDFDTDIKTEDHLKHMVEEYIKKSKNLGYGLAFCTYTDEYIYYVNTYGKLNEKDELEMYSEMHKIYPDGNIEMFFDGKWMVEESEFSDLNKVYMNTSLFGRKIIDYLVRNVNEGTDSILEKYDELNDYLEFGEELAKKGTEPSFKKISDDNSDHVTYAVVDEDRGVLYVQKDHNTWMKCRYDASNGGGKIREPEFEKFIKINN